MTVEEVGIDIITRYGDLTLEHDREWHAKMARLIEEVAVLKASPLYVEIVRLKTMLKAVAIGDNSAIVEMLDEFGPTHLCGGGEN